MIRSKGKESCPFCWSYDYENLRGVSKHSERIMNDTKIGHVKSSTFKTGRDEMLVWPWTVILDNNAKKNELGDRKYVRKNKQEIKKKLCSEGYKFSEVLLFSNKRL
ncbi:hypothetical protein P8452_72449 [Trifolium repens]|nr:hypothetical protein P8452_72449 [Trifolium repens]